MCCSSYKCSFAAKSQRCTQETSTALEVGTDCSLHAHDLAISSHRGPQELGITLICCDAVRASAAHLWQPVHTDLIEELILQLVVKTLRWKRRVAIPCGTDTVRTAPVVETTGCDTLRMLPYYGRKVRGYEVWGYGVAIVCADRRSGGH